MQSIPPPKVRDRCGSGTAMRDPLLEVYARRSHLSKGEQRVPQRNMGWEEEVRGLLPPGQIEALLHQLAQRL